MGYAGGRQPAGAGRGRAGAAVSAPRRAGAAGARPGGGAAGGQRARARARRGRLGSGHRVRDGLAAARRPGARRPGRARGRAAVVTSAWAALGQALSPVEDRPRVAPGLESASYKTRAGADYVVVHNPGTRTYARLDPREFELLSLMDGQHSVKELVIAYYQRYGVLALARVAGLVPLLRQQGFLAEGSVDPYPRAAPRLR